MAVRAALAAAGIEIAFPQHDIRIRNADGEQLDFLGREHKQVSDARPIV